MAVAHDASCAFFTSFFLFSSFILHICCIFVLNICRNMIYPIGIQNFEKIRKDGYVYVDKTALIYKMATTGSYYFLSRPRRFGKSLLLSTIEAYLSGKRELFEGLAIEKLEKSWAKHPILHLDLNTAKYSESADSLDKMLDDCLKKWELLYGTFPSETTFALRFKGIVERAFEKSGERVVILVDEYDKPLLEAIDNENLQNEFRSTLKAFYSVLKTQDPYIKLALLTGVTKFGKVNIFSDLNNLQDISMDERYIDICGITREEIHQYFDGDVAELGKKCGLSKEECYDKLKEQYDGYHFRQNSIGLYNPFSLLNTLAKMEFSDYWFESGTPSFLVQLLEKTGYNLEKLENEVATGDKLNSIDSMSYDPIPVIYQSGYLTIQGYNERFKKYRLGFPNKEVENGFINYLVPYFTPAKESKTEFNVENFIEDIETGRPNDFVLLLQSLFADTDYQIAGKMELYFQNAMYVIFKIMGFYTEVERTTSRGRIDILMKTKDYIYIMELKLDGSAKAALRQIEEKEYARPFANDGRKLYKIGINFSSLTRGIDEWRIEEE